MGIMSSLSKTYLGTLCARVGGASISSIHLPQFDVVRVITRDTASLLPDLAQMRHRSALKPLYVITLLAVAGCSGERVIEPQTAERVPSTISITPNNVSMTYLGQSVQVSARINDQNGIVMPTQIAWSLGDPSIASIATDGLLTAAAVGNTTLTAQGLGLTATVDLEVFQQVSTFAVTQGDNQEATRDSTLTDPIIVSLSDLGGTGIPGLAVTFSPGSDNGTVSVATATTDASGGATTEWTLGSVYGEQQLLVSVPGQSITVNAIARAEVPTADLAVVGLLQLSSVAPTRLETVTVTGKVTNLGDLESGPTRVSLTSNTAEVGTFDLPSLAPNDTTEVSFDVGPLNTGSNELTLITDADEVVVELFESNNEVTRSINVLDQAEANLDVPVTDLAADINTEMLFRVNVAGPTTLTVSFTAPSGDADVYVSEGMRPSSREEYVGCVSTGPTSVESCQIPFADGEYHILVHAFDQGAPVTGGTLTVTTSEALIPYDIELVFIDSGTQSQEDAFIAAAARWSRIIVADVQDRDFASSPLQADSCINGQPLLDRVVDDVVIYVYIGYIDGERGTLGSAGPCVIRGGSQHTVVGVMRFDDADLVRIETNGGLEGLILHEMGHVLGIGTRWDNANLLRNPSLPCPGPDGDNCPSPGPDTHFVGPHAITAFDNVGGVAFTSGSHVPVENEAGPGSGDSHWRESVFNTELMTPFYDGGFNPLSEVTIASLKDLGYGVDLTQGDTYFLPPQSSSQQGAAGAVGSPGFIDLGDDIWDERRYVLGKNGKIREILR